MEYLEKAIRVLDIEIFELKRLRDRLGEPFGRAVELIKEAVDARGKVVVLGIGNRGISEQKSPPPSRAQGRLPSRWILRTPYTAISGWSLMATSCWP